MSKRLTQIAHEAIAAVLHEGDTAIDATAGNGHDALMLARLVGESGRVIAFDVQSDAISATRARLTEHAQDKQVLLVQDTHANIAAHTTPESVAVVMFNLGYLPGSDKTVTTQASDTLIALEASITALRSGGILSVMAYRGHEGGESETTQVAAFFDGHADEASRLEFFEAPNNGPLLWLFTKQ